MRNNNKNGDTIRQSTITGSYTIIDDPAIATLSKQATKTSIHNKMATNDVLSQKIFTNRDKNGVLAQVESMRNEDKDLQDFRFGPNINNLVYKNEGFETKSDNIC